MLVRKIGKGYAGVSVLRGFREEWIDLMMQTRSRFANAYIQAITIDRILDENHVFLCLYNVVSAHEHGYGKMKRIDAELLLNISGLNRFEDALAETKPREGNPAFIVSYADDQTAAVGILNSFLSSASSCQECPRTDWEKPGSLAKSSGIKRKGGLSKKEALDVLAESSAMFYVRYR